MASATQFSPDGVGSSNYHSHVRAEMLPYVPASAHRVLDVGCGEGHFGQSVKVRGAEVWGIELEAAAADRARTRLDRVLTGDVAKTLPTLPAAQFDCIVFNDVLEHLVDPDSALLAAKRLLTPNGVIVCSLPNVRHFRNLWNLMIHKQWRYEDSGTLDRTHLRFFTERSMVDMFNRLDLEILQKCGINGFTSWKFRALGYLSLGLLSDAFHFQYAFVVRPR